MVSAPHAAELRARYQQYLRLCNRHDFALLGPLVTDVLEVNGHVQTLHEYLSSLSRLSHAFPDLQWRIQQMVCEPPWLAVHLTVTGTHRGRWKGVPPTGEPFSTEEFAMYRFIGTRIAEVHGTADNARLPR